MSHPTASLPGCPPAADLSRFALKQLDLPSAGRVQSHLLVCASCRRAVEESQAQLRGQLAALSTTPPARPQVDEATVSLAGSTNVRGPARSNSAAQTSAACERYRLGEEIARGGMGVVHRATDLLFKREVAIKLLHPKYRDNPQALAAFRYEAEITARLQHPGIPPMHDLGMLPDGRPFLAMKLIQGQTLHELLKTRDSLSDDLPRWLQIFEQVAQAVGYAHSQGIIHRDLKPLNVMVGEFGEVQVMDWGLAKLIGAAEQPEIERSGDQPQADDERPFATLPGDVKGTLQYMPPEQARGEVSELDARSDVFSLGAVLCQILTGSAPYASQPTSDLLRVAYSGQVADAIGRIRGSGADPEIVELAIRCLSPEKALRPESGTRVAQAIATHRASVELRLRQSETERAVGEQRRVEEARRRKLVWYGLAAVLVLISLASTTIAVIYARSNVIIADRELKAKNAALLAAEREKTAKIESATSTAVSGFLEQDLLLLAGAEEQAAAGVQVSPDLTVRELVLRTANRIEGKFQNQPVVEARIRRTLGVALSRLGDSAQAIEQFERATGLLSEHAGAAHSDTLDVMNNLAIAYGESGKPAQAIELHEKVLQLRRSQVDADPQDRIASLLNLATLYRAEGKRQEALALNEEALRICEKSLGERHPDSISALAGLAEALHEAGQMEKFLELSEKVWLRRLDVLGPNHPDTLKSQTNLAAAYGDSGDSGQALLLLERSYVGLSRILGANHPTTIAALDKWAGALRQSGQLERSLALHEQALKLAEQELGADHHDTLMYLNNVAVGLVKAGQPQRAVELHERIFKVRTAKLRAHHPDTLLTAHNLALATYQAGDAPRAITMLESVAERREEELGRDHADTLESLLQLAHCYEAAGNVDKSLPLYERLVQSHTAKFGAGDLKTLDAKDKLALDYFRTGQSGRAVPMLEEIVKVRTELQGREHLDTVGSFSNLANLYLAMGQLEKAIPLAEEAVQQFAEQLGPDHPHAAGTRRSLVNAYRRLDQLDKAIALYETTYEQLKTRLGADHPQTLAALNELGDVLGAAGQVERATTVLTDSLQRHQQKLGDDHPATLKTLYHLGVAYKDVGAFEKALDLFERALKGLTEQLGPLEFGTLDALTALCETEIELKQFESAETHAQEQWNRAQKLTGRSKRVVSESTAELFVQLYDAWAKPQEAAEWRDKLRQLGSAN